jgi:CMP-N,N'-diacetyllegionaminic acid synthase
MTRHRACRTLGVITARAGSKGIPHKNVVSLAGEPLIIWTLRAARAATRLDRTIVSTDGEEIARVVAGETQVEVLMRPPELSLDDTPSVDVLLHVLNELSARGGEAPSHVVLLQPTSPLRTGGDIDEAIELAHETGAPAVVSVCEARTHPFLAYRMDDGGRLAPFLESARGYRRRQALPPAYAPNGAVFVVRTDVLKREGTLYPVGALGLVMSETRSIDIDTELDLRVAEMLISEELHG